jgi:hypothetical protein
MTTLLPSEIDTSMLIIEDKKQLPNHGPYFCRIKYNKSNLLIQGPKTLTKIVNAFELKGTKSKTDDYFIEIRLDDKQKDLKKLAIEIDEMNINYIIKNSESLIGNKITREDISLVYTPIVKKPKPGSTYLYDKIKIKLPYKEKKENNEVIGKELQFKASIQDINNEWKEFLLIYTNPATGLLDFDRRWAKNYIEIVPIFRIDGLMLIEKKIYCTLKMVWFRKYNYINTIKESSFREDAIKDSYETPKEKEKTIQEYEEDDKEKIEVKKD